MAEENYNEMRQVAISLFIKNLEVILDTLWRRGTDESTSELTELQLVHQELKDELEESFDIKVKVNICDDDDEDKVAITWYGDKYTIKEYLNTILASLEMSKIYAREAHKLWKLQSYLKDLNE